MEDIEGQEMDESDIKNDFAYHNNVTGAAKHIRMGFLRKVYGLLAAQLSLTTLIAAVCMFTPQLKEGIQAYPVILLLSFILSMGLLLALHIKRRETPINFILLAAFTVVEALTVGVVVSMYDVAVVLQAFFLTAAVVVALTAYTFQTKRDFSGWGAALFAGLWILILGGFMQIFLGGKVTDLAMALGGALLFSMFIICVS